MGFRCPVCKKDFKRDKKEWEKHIKECCGGAAADMVGLIKKICEKKNNIRRKNGDR